MDSLRVYVASLSDYNAGILHGAWIDVTTTDEMQESIDAMLAASPTAKSEGVSAEEWAIHDFEGFGPYKVSEHESLDTLEQLAEGYDKHDGAFLAWASNDKSNTEVSDFEDAYAGEWDSLADYVADYWEQSGDMPQAPEGSWWHPANYINWERMAHDLEVSGDIWTERTPDGKVWVFNNH